MGKGEDLNKRVWELFAKAGFQTKPNSSDPDEYAVPLTDKKTRPVDLFAKVPDLEVTILGSNKSMPKLKSFTAHMHDLHTLTKAAKADVALFVAGDKDMEESEREYAKKYGVVVWDERQLRYYEAVTDALGLYAKFEIIHALGLTTSEEQLKDTVLGIRLRQPRNEYALPNTELYMFTLPAEKLLKMCGVLRKARGSAFAYQRILSKKRLPNIGNFVRTPEALLPTNIIVHLGEDVEVDEIKSDYKTTDGKRVHLSRQDHQLVALTLPIKYGSMELIDGQHRLFGFIHADGAARKNFNLVVLGIRDMAEDRKSKAFVAINDNARRVDANLVAYLRYTDDEKTCQQNADLMAIKIVVELNKLSPFRDAIRLFDVGKQKLTLKGLSGYDLRGLVGTKGILRKYYPENASSDYIRTLRVYFNTIQGEFKVEWANPDTYIIATNRGITAFLKLLRSIHKTEDAPLDKPVAKNYIVALKKHWKEGWETANLKKSYVGNQGWKQFHNDMVDAIQKEYSDFEP